MKQLIAIALGGAFGAVLRYLFSVSAHQLFGKAFPYGTLIVNVLGSFVLGLLSILLLERYVNGLHWRALLLIGLLGAFTTFSTFSWETIMLLENGQLPVALLNIFLNISLCLVAVWLGLNIGRLL